MESATLATGTGSEDFVKEQLSIQRGNLLGICRMCVKSLVDKAAFETITDSCPHLQNFCNIMEHILSYRLQTRWTLFGNGNPVQFWLVIYRFAPSSTVTSVQDMEEIQSDVGKGRAWIRLALVQKKLSTFISSLLSKSQQLTNLYLPGGFLCSEQMIELAGTLKCLDAIDFNLCLRGQDFDFGGKREICYAPYLRFRQSTTSIADDSREEKKLKGKSKVRESEQENDEEEEEEESLTQLRENFIAERDQKNYFEELVSVRDAQLASVRSELASVSQESEQQKKELEDVVLELQQQIGSLQRDLREAQRKLESLPNGKVRENSVPEGNSRGFSPRKRAATLFSSFLGNED